MGRANSGGQRRWNRTNSQRTNNSTMRGWGAGAGNDELTRPPVQTTPFILGVNVMQTKSKPEDSSITTPNNTEDAVKTNYQYVPSKELEEAHPGQLRPTPSMYTLTQSLFRKNVMEWTLQDFYTPGVSDGTSILLSIFMDHATTTLHPKMTISNRESLAKIVTAVAPADLLNYLQDATAAVKFLDWALTFEVQIPPTFEMHLCPIRTLNLIPRDIRLKITEEELTTEEQERVIEAFTKCYYPKSASMVKDLLPTIPDATVKDFIVQPGRLAAEMKNRHKSMVFQPPKWYRLSIHPDTVIQSPPKLAPPKPKTCEDLPFSAAELRGKLTMELSKLEVLPLQTMKATIFAAISTVFGERQSQEGLIEAFSIMEATTKEDIINFLQKGFEQSTVLTDEEVDKTRELHRYYIRFEHTNRRRHEEWQEQTGEILRKWINVIHPVLVANNHILVLTTQPYVRTQNDRLVYMTPYSLDSSNLQEYVIEKTLPSQNKTENRGSSRFEVWIKTTCAYLEDMADHTQSGELANAYSDTMEREYIQVQYISRIADSIVPAVMIGGSIETADDEIIEEELGDRLIRMGVDSDTFPVFHVEQVSIGTSTGSVTIRTKCIMAKRAEVETIQSAFGAIPTPVSKAVYQVTSDYIFTPVKYPPTDQTDKELSAAIGRQNDFTKSIVKTTIYNLHNVAPYHDVPICVKDPCTNEIEKNTAKKTVAAIILDMKFMVGRDIKIRSPVIRVSTNSSGSKLHLTALRTEAEDLITATQVVARLIDTWYDGKFKVLKDMTDARTQIKRVQTTRLQQQAMDGGMMFKWGEINKEQKKLDSSKTVDELTKTAAKGIQGTFTRAETHTSIYNEEEVEREQGSTAAPPASVVTNSTSHDIDIRRDIGVLKELAISQDNKMSEMTLTVSQVVNMVQKLDKAPDETMVNTISTMIETGMQSSISSTTEATSACKIQMEEYCKQMQRQMEESTLALIQSCKDKLNSETNPSKLEDLVKRQEMAAETTRIALAEIKTHQTEMMKKMDEQRTYMENLLHQREKTAEAQGVDEDEVTFDHQEDVAEESTKTKYARDARKKAHDILNLMDTMPYRKLSDLETNTTKKDAANEEDAFHTSVVTDICQVCKKKDLGLMYCDTCEELGGLYHAACLTLTDKATRSCDECIGKKAAHAVSAPAEDKNESRVGNNRSTMDTSKVEIGTAAASDMDTADDTNETSSTSSSESTSSSGSSVKPYTPRVRRALGETTLPTLKPTFEANPTSHAEKSTTQDISPLKTRGQRLANKAQKIREDAYDTSDEEEADK